MTFVDVFYYVLPGSIFLLGLVVGSFLNVCIYRLPRQCLSLISPGSRCPACQNPISWYDNIPVVSYLFLGGNCRHCGTSISIRYPLVELLTGCLFLTVYYFWWELEGGTFEGALRSDVLLSDLFAASFLTSWLELVLRLVLISGLLVITFIDAEFRIIPDELSVGAILLGPLVCTVYPEWLANFGALPGLNAIESRPVRGLLGSLLGMIAGGGTVYGLKVFGRLLFGKPAMGWGDVKLMAGIGAFMGWTSIPLVLVGASFIGTIAGIFNLVVRGSRYISFGPFLAFSAGLLLLRSRWILDMLREEFMVAF